MRFLKERKRQAGTLIAIILLAASAIAIEAMTNDAVTALACCGGGGW